LEGGAVSVAGAYQHSPAAVIRRGFYAVDSVDDHENIRSELLSAAVSPELAKLVEAMKAQGHPVASQLELLRRIKAVVNGSAHNGYTMARTEGKSREEAISAPATAALLSIADYLRARFGESVFEL